MNFFKMKLNFGKNVGDSKSIPLCPAQMRKRNAGQVWIPMEDTGPDKSDISKQGEQSNNNDSLASVKAARPPKWQGSSSFCIPAAKQQQISHTQKRLRSKSLDILEANSLHQRSRKLRRLTRWKLVENIIPILGVSLKARVTANRVKSLNTRLLDAIKNHRNTEESLLLAGADPNATCRVGHISACHAAAYANSNALRLLLKFHANKNRRDKFGRTPLHLAALAGDALAIAMLLDFPIDFQKLVETGVTSEVEEEIKTLREVMSNSVIDVTCDLAATTALPLIWNDSVDHKCRKYMICLPTFFSGWTPLHIASYASNHGAARLLLAAGANPNSKDAMGKTPLDVAGTACYEDLHSNGVNVDDYVSTIKALIDYGGKLDVLGKTSSNSALHTAVKISSVEAIQVLLAAGAPIWHKNDKGNTPLHECVASYCKETLLVLANHHISDIRGQHYPSVDVGDSSGNTVLHAAILASWVSGVCVALEAGADVTLEAHDGKTAIHIAAFKGNLDILDEIFCKAAQGGIIDSAVNYNNRRTEPPIFSAIRSGNLECVQAFLDAGALLKITCYVEPTSGDTIIPIYDFHQKSLNMILHATAEIGNVDMLELLLDHDKSLEQLLDYKCLYLEAMTPVEFAAHHNRFNTFKFLLVKTLERERKSHRTFDHSNLLYIIATRNCEDLFEELMKQIPDAVRTAPEKGCYPLHGAAKNSNRNLIMQLIDNGADLSEEDDCGVTAINLINDNISKPTEFLAKILDNYINLSSNKINTTDCEIIVDYSVLIPTTVNQLENKDQLRVVTTLLKTANHQNQKKLLAHPLIESFLYLRWKTLPNYFYLMVILYCLFVTSLSFYTISIFYYKDQYNKTMTEPISVPWPVDPYYWKYIVYFTLSIVLFQELSHMNLVPKTWAIKILSIEFWLKCIPYSFGIAISLILSMESNISAEVIDWRRYLATAALVMAWLNVMMMLSKTPMTGYYIQMFWIVSSKVFKILFTFVFLIFMFSICFMIQFHTRAPFDGPWAAFVKTLVMMTSEFDYGDTFSTDTAEKLSTPIQLLRLVFLIFLILTAIVLMNLMTGVAVHDVQCLVQDGNLKRLEKQVVFLNNLEVSRGKSFFHFIGLYRWFECDNVSQTMKIKPVNDDDECCYSSAIKEAIINKVQEQMDKKEREAHSNKLESKIEELSHDVLHHILELKSQLENCQSSLDRRTD